MPRHASLLRLALTNSACAFCTNNFCTAPNVSIKRDSGRTSDALVESAAETNARILGGAVSGSPAQKSAGITLTFLYDEDAAKTDIGKGVSIEGGKVALKSSADTAVQTFNAAASVNTGEQGSQTLGGAVNVLVLRNSARTNAGTDLTVASGSSIDVTAGANMDLKLVSAGISGARRGTAAGGTLAYIDDGADSEVNVGDRHSFDAVDKIAISAVTKDKLISVLASASAATSAEGKTYAAAINVMNSSAKGNVTLGSDSLVKSRATKGIDILGIAGSTAINITVAAADSGGRAIGASVNANFYNRESTVNIGNGNADYAIEAANDILISAAGDDTTVMVGVAAAGSTDGMAIGGNLPIVSSKNTVSTKLARTTVNATKGEAAIASHLRDRTYAIAGSIALANGGSAAGATALLAFKKNTVTTDLGESSVTVAGSSGKLASRVAGNPTFKGLYVGAADDNTVFVGAAGMALSSEKGITGNLVTLSSANTVLADASRAALTALQTPDTATGGNVTVVARNDNYQTLFAGGLNFGLSMGIGASLAVLVSENDVRVKAHDIDSFGNVSVTAMNDEHLLGLNVNAGGSGKTAVELGASILSIRSRVNAEVASAITARNGDFDLKADNTTDLTDLAVALAGAGEVAASPVFVATVFGGEANAKLNAGTVTAAGGVNAAADSTKNIDQYTVGASFAGETALSGAVSVVSIKDQTNALVGKDTDITANTLGVTAFSDYKLNSASAAVSGGKIAGAVNGMVNIVKASTLAEMEGRATLSGAANVSARSVRDIVNVEATLGAGQTGVGFAVMATVAGDRLDDDAVDMLTYGSAENKDNGKTFDADAMVKSLKDMGVDTSSLEEQKDEQGNVTQTSLADDLTGNGQRMSTTQVGDGDKFDASSGYVSDDLYSGGDGADAQFTESADLRQARTVGGSAYTEDPKDAVNARVGGNAVLSANGVTVKAEQQTLADMYGATVGAGASTGVGISFAAAILRSNVFATSLGDIDAHEGDVVVDAVSHTGDITPEAGSDEEQRMKSVNESLGNTINLTKRSIRTIGLAVGGAGTAAVAIAAGIVRLDNITDATMGGTVTNAGKVTVNADSKYGNVLAATLAAAGSGEMAVSGSIAATGMHGTTRARLDGTADISGKDHNVEIITALTDSAFKNPVIPIGSAGKLDFVTGAFTLPENADFGLYLREISGAWLIEKIADGFIRRLDADQSAIDACVMDDAELPLGVIIEGLTEDGEVVTGSGETGDLAIWKRCWLGDTPDTAAEADQTLIFLLLKEETDEVDAFRTSVNRIRAGEAPVDVSLYLFRDSGADSMGVEKYNCMFFDTPEGEKSRVRVVTNVLTDSILQNPMPATITLRSFPLKGADVQAYAINDHCFVMCDGTDGEVSMFGGVYRITFDGNCFESDYMRIEGIIDGNLKITLKHGQTIWPEWSGSDTSVDIQGDRYVYIDNAWHNADEFSQIPDDAEAA